MDGAENKFKALPPFQRGVVLLVGHISIVLGVTALLLPVIPTTPFLILAAACYARTSESFYNRLLSNKYVGPDIARWRQERCMQKRAKFSAISLLAVAFIASSFLFFDTLTGRLIMLSVGFFVSLMIYFIPSCDER